MVDRIAAAAEYFGSNARDLRQLLVAIMQTASFWN